MKKYLLLILMLVNLEITIAQSNAKEIIYKYDESGNRIERKLAFIDLESQQDLVFNLGNNRIVNVKAMPNPVNSTFSVLIVEDYKSEDILELKITDNNGIILKAERLYYRESYVDVANFVPGIYTVILSINNKMKMWKILKQ